MKCRKSHDKVLLVSDLKKYIINVISIRRSEGSLREGGEKS